MVLQSYGATFRKSRSRRKKLNYFLGSSEQSTYLKTSKAPHIEISSCRHCQAEAKEQPANTPERAVSAAISTWITMLQTFFLSGTMSSVFFPNSFIISGFDGCYINKVYSESAAGTR